MKKPNKALKYAAAAIQAQRRAQASKTEAARAFFAKRAQQLMARAAGADDAIKAVRIIKASNAQAASMRADFDDLDDMPLDDMQLDDMPLEADDVFEDSDPIVGDDMITDEDMLLGSDKEEKKEDDDDEVDARLASILARTRARRSAMARIQAKRQLRR